MAERGQPAMATPAKTLGDGNCRSSPQLGARAARQHSCAAAINLEIVIQLCKLPTM